MDTILTSIRDELEAVEKGLWSLSRSGNRFIDKAVPRILKAGGKRLRPALLLFSAKACRYCGEKSIQLGVAMELIHTASLIHDDVIDDAIVRRGISTINVSQGNRLSILAGDYIYSQVFSILAEVGNQEVLRSVAATTRSMVEGEIFQTLGRKNGSLSEADYAAIIACKTASLISCSCRAGALLGPQGDGEVEILTDYGQNLGMAFQITDDVLDIVGDERQLGKSPGNDIREGKLTLPFIHTLAKADRKDRKWIQEVFTAQQLGAGILKKVRDMLHHYGGIEYSLNKAREYGRAGKERLQGLVASAEREALAQLADYVVHRFN